MATTTIIVPADSEHKWYTSDVEAEIVAGNDVIFQDASGNDVDVAYIMLADGAGNVMCRSSIMADADQCKLYFTRDGWHMTKIHKIFATGTDTGKAIHVRA